MRAAPGSRAFSQEINADGYQLVLLLLQTVHLRAEVGSLVGEGTVLLGITSQAC